MILVLGFCHLSLPVSPVYVCTVAIMTYVCKALILHYDIVLLFHCEQIIIVKVWISSGCNEMITINPMKAHR